MGKLWTPVVQRVGRIISAAYGSEHPVPASTFSIDSTRAGLSQDGEPIAQRIRSVRVTPQASRWTEGEANSRSGENAKTLRVEVRIGYRGDTDPAMTATTADVQADAELQALDDWDGVVLDALRRPVNWVGLTPELYDVSLVGEATVEATAEGLVDLVATLDLSVSFDPATVWSLGG